MDVNIVVSEETTLPELLQTQTITLQLSELTENTLLHALMDWCLMKSHRWVEEAFHYKGVARFSRDIKVREIAELSVKTRVTGRSFQASGFDVSFREANYLTDKNRVPKISGDIQRPLIQQQKKHLASFDIVAGFLPELER